MSNFPNSPKLLKGGIVLVDSATAAVQRIISLQYDPDTLTRSLQIQGVTVMIYRYDAKKGSSP
jgi:hypothetical protein